MISPDLDQAIATLRDFYGAAAWAFYSEWLERGFTKEQAFRLTRDWLTAYIAVPDTDDEE